MNTAGCDFFKLSKGLLNEKKRLCFHAEGQSMHPVIQHGDKVFIEPIDQEQLLPGDIVLYCQPPSKPTIHRIVKKSGSSAIIQGDSNTGSFESIPLRYVYGRIYSIKRAGLLRYSRNPRRNPLDKLRSSMLIFQRKARMPLAHLLQHAQSSSLYRGLIRKTLRPDIYYGWKSQIGGDRCLLATHKSRIVGKVFVDAPPRGDKQSGDYDGWWLYGMWVAWPLRREGIGANLLSLATRYLLEKKVKKVALLVFEDNEPARELYKKAGFERVIIPSIEKELEEEAKQASQNRRRIMLEKNLDLNARNVVPAAICTASEHDHYVRLAKSIALQEKLQSVLAAFEQEHIKAMILKGLFLTKYIYKDDAARPMTDIDILIQRKDLKAAHHALINLGYEAPGCYQDFLSTNTVCSINTLMYVSAQTQQPLVHLHWHLINTTWPLDHFVSAMDMDRFWAKARPLDFDGIKTQTLWPEHLLFYLALHNFNHFFKKPLLSFDIAQVIRHYRQLDWDFFIAETRRFGLSFIIYCSLLQVCRNCAMAIDALKRLKPQTNMIERLILYTLKRKKLQYLGCLLAYYHELPGLRHKCRFIIKLFLPHKLVLAHSLNCRQADIGISDYLQRILRR